MTKQPLAPRISSSGTHVTDQETNHDKSKDGEESIIASEPNPKPTISTNNKEDLTMNMLPNIIKKQSASTVKPEIVDDLVSIEDDDSNKDSRLVPKRTYSASSILEVSEGINVVGTNFQQPLWGSTSVRGRRAEMEDYAVAIPGFCKIPFRTLSDGALLSSDLTAHFFAVYDGHGGFQVADYCRENLHLALAEEVKENLLIERSSECNNSKELWQKAFLKCFRRMDDEVGGFEREVNGNVSHNPPIAADSVGSTAVVVIVCSTHIIVANCGDSRAVLNRGKVPMPLSVDHKPSREDECARIEAAGGRIINWDGCRVSGILAVSRSIGDRLLRPYVIADPEVMVVPRTKQDECLVIASDGLWDVVTEDEACDLTRRRILLWHKKYGATERGRDVDPASQDASDYLTRLAFQRGSRDNISVIVVDLKSQRRFKKKI